jgi:hypothetical protein
VEHGLGAKGANPSVVEFKLVYGLRIALGSYCLSMAIDRGDIENAEVHQAMDGGTDILESA